jgi:hypothetical protein
MDTGARINHPGRIVEKSRIHRCDVPDDDHSFESTDVKGHRFPPRPDGCRRSGWLLERVTGSR